MNKRIFNILFDLHTVSSIVISVALYVIFFAGSFSFFRDEIVNWERGHELTVRDEIGINLDTLISSLEHDYDLQGRDVEFSHYYNERRVGVSLRASKDSTASEAARLGAFFYVDTEDKSQATYPASYTLGEFLYRLHFFAPIPYPYGYHLSGFVAFFFLFAILTGILVHWKKIVSNFYVFRPWAQLKAMWTDAHTALGLIGFPFQLVYALTGAYLMLNALMMTPYVEVLYNGQEAALRTELGDSAPDYPLSYQPVPTTKMAFNSYLEKAHQHWKGFQVTHAKIYNYGDANAHLQLSGHLGYTRKMNGTGQLTYHLTDGTIVAEQDPTLPTGYVASVKNLLHRLHLADYAGLGLRTISFVLGLLSCVVILSGVMIWVTARDKRSTPLKMRRFNHWVGWIYLAICLSLYPMIAIEFLIVKFFPYGTIPFLYRTFFIGWLLLSILFVSKRNSYFTLKWSLLLGGGVGVLIPLVNGWVSGNWLWVSWHNQQLDILFVDVFWWILAASSFFAVAKLAARNKIATLGMMVD